MLSAHPVTILLQRHIVEDFKPSPRLQRRESLTAQLVRHINDRITNGEYKPGDRLPSEQEFCETFGVSRSVVREAISGLRAEGIISTKHGVGAFVLPPPVSNSFRIEEKDLETLQEVVRVLDLRICVEAEAAALAAKRRGEAELATIKEALDTLIACTDGREPSTQADFRFHQTIAIATNNRYFVEILAFLTGMLMPRMRVDLFKDDEEGRVIHVESINGEHENIYLAIAAGNGEDAYNQMRLHLSRSRDRLQRICNEQR